ncbi:MAG: YvcK family protein [Candidatus Colwellbacteria bacterium]|nr:YvcK family protein [Candidatus Colwellbacteria bacterium]
MSKKVVAFGGGSALPSLVLPALKKLNLDITTATSMTDNGGSTGALRKEFGVHAMGDIRRHLLALSDAEDWKKELWKFRFANDLVFEDGHKGHNFANVFIAGLEKITGDYEKTLAILHDFLKVKAQCFPATEQKVELFAELENGDVIEGEDPIDVARPNRDIKLKIVKIWLTPTANGYPKLIDAIGAADYIIIGPGDLYSSVLPCFLPKGIKEAIQSSKAKMIYTCNLLAKPGETYKFTASDHVKEILKYTGRNKLDYLIAADENLGKEYLKSKNMKEYYPVKIDSENLERLAHKIIVTDSTKVEEMQKTIKEITK